MFSGLPLCCTLFNHFVIHMLAVVHGDRQSLVSYGFPRILSPARLPIPPRR
jgi:hypothetical protein